MKLKLSKHRLRDLLHQRNLLLSLVMALLLINFTQALLVLFRSERVVMVPPDLKQEVWLEKNKVSPSYLEEMTLVFAALILESSPESAAFKRDIILRHASEAHYGALKRQLIEDEARLKKEHVATSFQASGVQVFPETLTVTLKGDLSRFVGEKKISQSRDVYQFNFEYRHGRLLIKSFSLLKTDARS